MAVGADRAGSLDPGSVAVMDQVLARTRRLVGTGMALIDVLNDAKIFIDDQDIDPSARVTIMTAVAETAVEQALVAAQRASDR